MKVLIPFEEKRRQTRRVVASCLVMSTKTSLMKDRHSDSLLELHEAVPQMWKLILTPCELCNCRHTETAME